MENKAVKEWLSYGIAPIKRKKRHASVWMANITERHKVIFVLLVKHHYLADVVAVVLMTPYAQISNR